ncbi:MAG TPA: acetylxylan esterase [Bryobacteraceae bacterium]|nr:acetylxylan esterase [Bryobacteraceae bacterium]
MALVRLCLGTALVTFAFAAQAPVTIPPISGSLAIDGALDDPAWRDALVLPLSTTEFADPFPAGGESRVAVRGAYLCLSARIPEPGRVVAHSTGTNPNWWAEDLVSWTFRIHSAATRRNLTVELTVNPLGAYRFQNAATREPLAGAEKILAAARLGAGEWTVEAAVPLDRLALIGFIDVQRVRASRPDAPELHWYWPAASERAAFRLAEASDMPAPEFHAVQYQPATPKPARAVIPELAWLPANVWTDAEHDRLHDTRMLENSLRVRAGTIADDEKHAWQKVDSREAWESFRDQRLAALRKWLGPFPERTDLHAMSTRGANFGNGFVIQKLIFESRPHLVVTANLYMPENSPGKIPAIIVVHSHHAPKTQSELQDLGMTWARAGVAVLVMDQLCAGERLQSQPWYRESYYARYALGNQLLVAGESLMKWMVWDLMRAVDFLASQASVDAQRIVMLGAVAGGGDPAAVTAALDPRIAAVIPFNFGEAGPEEHYIAGPRGYLFDTAWPGWGEWETTRCLPRSIVDQYFPWFICASVAPRPFLYSFEIGWPEGVEHEPAWARYQKVFGFYGARDHLDEVHGYGPFPGPGECTNVGTFLRKGIYPVLQRWLNIPAPVAEYHDPRPDSELMCLTPAVAAERRPKPASALALDLVRERLAEARSRISNLDALRAAVKQKLGDIEPAEHPVVHTLWTKEGNAATAEGFSIETEPGITLPVLLLKPAHVSARIPAVIAVAHGGKSRYLAERSDQVMALLKNGIAVCLPDLRETGELVHTEQRGPGAMDLAATELMLGRTMLGAQVADLRSVFRYLASRSDLDPAHIALSGDSFAETNPAGFAFDQSDMQEPGPFVQHQAEPMGGLAALFTALYEDRVAGVAVRGSLVSFLSMLEDRFCHVPMDAVVPGILEAADISDIVRALGSRPVLLQGLVDGRNRLVPKARVESEFKEASKPSEKLVIRETPEDASAWLSGVLARKGKS